MAPPRVIRTLAKLVVLFLTLLGLTGLLSPDTLTSLMVGAVTAPGLYTVGAVRIAVGVILFRVAPGSRAPMALRVLGVLVVMAGFGTLFLGVDRAKAIFDTLTSYGPNFIRMVGVGALLIASGIGYAISGNRSAS